MHTTVNFSQFCDAFIRMGREENFTYLARRALFDYLEELEDDIGSPIELDVIALCCEYSEYDSAVEAAETQGWEAPAQDDEEDLEDYTERCNEDALDWLRDRTTVVEFDSGIIIQDF